MHNKYDGMKKATVEMSIPELHYMLFLFFRMMDEVTDLPPEVVADVLCAGGFMPMVMKLAKAHDSVCGGQRYTELLEKFEKDSQALMSIPLN